jgi:hypothetical protein
MMDEHISFAFYFDYREIWLEARGGSHTNTWRSIVLFEHLRLLSLAQSLSAGVDIGQGMESTIDNNSAEALVYSRF